MTSSKKPQPPLPKLAVKLWEFLTTSILGASVLFCALLIVYSGSEIRRLDRILASQQAEINKGQAAGQAALAVLQDMAAASASSPALLKLLEKQGFKVNFTPPPGSEAAPPPATP